MFHLPFHPFWAILIDKLFHYVLTNGASLCNPAKIREAAQNPKNCEKTSVCEYRRHLKLRPKAKVLINN